MKTHDELTIDLLEQIVEELEACRNDKAHKIDVDKLYEKLDAVQTNLKKFPYRIVCNKCRYSEGVQGIEDTDMPSGWKRVVIDGKKEHRCPKCAGNRYD